MMYQTRSQTQMRHQKIAQMPMEAAPMITGRTICQARGHKWKYNSGDCDDFCTRCFKWRHPIHRLMRSVFKGAA